MGPKQDANVPFSAHAASYRPPAASAPGPGMHSHDGVNFHGSHAAPQPAPGQHSHDGINFHGAHDQQQPAGGGGQLSQQQMQMLMRMMQQQQLAQQQQQHQGHHGQHSHDGVNFHGSHDEPSPPPGQHSHDGINFHGSHDAEGHGHGGGGHEEPKDEAGKFGDRVLPYTSEEGRDWKSKGFSIGIAGPCGSGKTTLVEKLCKAFKKKYSMCVIVNDLYTTIDAQQLIDGGHLDKDRVKGLTTGIWSRVAIDEDVEDNFTVGEAVSQKFGCQIVVFEAAGDNLGANFDRNLSDFTIFVLDTAGGEKMPLKGGKGVTQADLLVINKTDLAEPCGVDLKVLEANAKQVRGEGPVVMASLKRDQGVEAIMEAVRKQYAQSGAKAFFEAQSPSGSGSASKKKGKK